MTDKAKFRELIAKHLEEIANTNEGLDGTNGDFGRGWIAGIRDAAGFVRRERFPRPMMTAGGEKQCPECYRIGNEVCTVPSECYFRGKSEPDCECGHTVGAHFDGNMNYQACLHEGCECVEYHSARAKSTLEKINFTDVKPPSNAPDGFSIWYATEVAKARYFKATMGEQSESYLRSDQSEQSSQSQGLQLLGHFQDKSPHAHIVANLLARMANIPGLDPPEELAPMREQFSQTLLVLSTCEEVECRGVHRLVELVLNNLLL
jgi:hypothetical protein